MKSLHDGQASSIVNQPYMDPTLADLRLKTRELIQQIEIYLSGEKVEHTIQNDQIVSIVNQITKPKCNSYGLSSILNWISMVINPQVVQGNFPMNKMGFSQEFEDFCYYFRMDMGDYLMINLDSFAIDESEYNGMLDCIMNIIRPFMSRLIDNKERESYYKTLESKESTNTMSKGGLNFMNRG